MKGFALSILLLGASAGAAAANCYRDVVEFSAGICAEFVGLSGKVAAEKYSGSLGASLDGLIEKLADLDGNVDVEVARNRYENILQQDVPAALQEGRDCRLEVAKLFFDRICPAQGAAVAPAPAPAPAPASASAPASALEPGWKWAVVADPDGWTNIRSGPGTEFQIVTKIHEGQTFSARPSDSNWWQVRASDGAAGYMHVSRIRLRP